MMDIERYKQEKLGSRPIRGFLSASGIDDKQLKEAIRLAEVARLNEGNEFFGQVVALAARDKTLKIELVPVTSLPDGFDEETSMNLGVYATAFAFGVDAREFWPATASGATKADATVQHLKAAGKAPGHIIEMVEQQLNQKFLPPHLHLYFDHRDDAADQQRAEIAKVRSVARKQNLDGHVINLRVAREQAMADGEITLAQFEAMELNDGRLPGGEPVLSLFYSEDKEMQSLLNLGVNDPMAINRNNAANVLEAIQRQEMMINTVLINTNSPVKKGKALQALAALQQLRKNYDPFSPAPLEVPDERPAPPIANYEGGINDVGPLANTETEDDDG